VQAATRPLVQGLADGGEGRARPYRATGIVKTDDAQVLWYFETTRSRDAEQADGDDVAGCEYRSLDDGAGRWQRSGKLKNQVRSVRRRLVEVTGVIGATSG
jgi:hypothetical protein